MVWCRIVVAEGWVILRPVWRATRAIDVFILSGFGCDADFCLSGNWVPTVSVTSELFSPTFLRGNHTHTGAAPLEPATHARHSGSQLPGFPGAAQLSHSYFRTFTGFLTTNCSEALRSSRSLPHLAELSYSGHLHSMADALDGESPSLDRCCWAEDVLPMGNPKGPV